MATKAKKKDPKPDPFCESDDCRRIAEHLRLIDDIMAGEGVIKRRGERYLPRYEAETHKSYATRLAAAPWRPEYRDAVLGIASKPFSKPVTIAGDNISEKITEFADDVDGAGTNLHRFAEKVFRTGIAKGLSVILVDFTKKAESDDPLTLADEKRLGLRPYFVKYDPDNVLACYFGVVQGRWQIVHLRVLESYTALADDGYSEKCVERVTVWNPGKYETWERDNDNSEPTLVDSGIITLQEVPAVAFFAGEVQGHFYVRPPLLDIAYLQLELYRALSRESEVLTYAGSPMLKLAGVEKDSLPVEDDGTGKKVPTFIAGPKQVIILPRTQDGAQPDAAYIQPDAENLKAIRDQVDSIVEAIRHYALQPMMPKTGDVTATSDALSSAKAHSAVQSWAMNLSDVLTQALAIAARWLNVEPNAVVVVNTDFAADILPNGDVQQLINLWAARGLSLDTVWEELERRGTLGPSFDPVAEKLRIETDGDIGEAA